MENTQKNGSSQYGIRGPWIPAGSDVMKKYAASCAATMGGACAAAAWRCSSSMTSSSSAYLRACSSGGSHGRPHCAEVTEPPPVGDVAQARIVVDELLRRVAEGAGVLVAEGEVPLRGVVGDCHRRVLGPLGVVLAAGLRRGLLLAHGWPRHLRRRRGALGGRRWRWLHLLRGGVRRVVRRAPWERGAGLLDEGRCQGRRRRARRGGCSWLRPGSSPWRRPRRASGCAAAGHVDDMVCELAADGRREQPYAVLHRVGPCHDELRRARHPGQLRLHGRRRRRHVHRETPGGRRLDAALRLGRHSCCWRRRRRCPRCRTRRWRR